MDKVQKEVQIKDLNNLLVKLQKPIIIFLFFAIILVFVYSLIYMTPFYGLFKIDEPFRDAALKKYGIDGKSFPVEAQVIVDGSYKGLNTAYFTDIVRNENLMQAFNKWMFNISFIGILVSFLLFVYFSQKRKRYYVTNYVSIVIVSAFDLYVGFSLISKLTYWKAQMLTVNYDVINAYLNYTSETTVYSASSFDWMFNLGYVVAGILIFAVTITLALTVCKFIYQLKNAEIDVSEVKINE